jgi:hypothetical protein
MRVAFVGMQRKLSELDPSYLRTFFQYHLEIPWYYAVHAGIDVLLVTSEPIRFTESFWTGGSFTCVHGDSWKTSVDVDAVVHWRSFDPASARPDVPNILHTCDHSYPQAWLDTVRHASVQGLLHYISCYRTWHVEQVHSELGSVPEDRFLTDLTLGVDSDLYRPEEGRDPYKMLWASDPGRGLQQAMTVAMAAWTLDRRFRLHICYPDYSPKPDVPKHPALVDRGYVKNGPELWELWNSCSILPYASSFKEPSSRAHRQSQSAGMVVLYPPDMGSPSRLIEHGRTGLVLPLGQWPRALLEAARGKHDVVRSGGRELAVSEDWRVQASRFRKTVSEILSGGRPAFTWRRDGQ